MPEAKRPTKIKRISVNVPVDSRREISHDVNTKVSYDEEGRGVWVEDRKGSTLVPWANIACVKH